jgi:integrase
MTSPPDHRSLICQVCGTAFPYRGRGQPAAYCTSQCRLAARRERSRAKPAGQHAPRLPRGWLLGAHHAALEAAQARCGVLGELYGWSEDVQRQVHRALHLALHDQPDGQRVSARQIAALLSPLRLNIKRVLQILADLDLLDDDRVPAIYQWIDRKVATYPEPYQPDIRAWLTWLHEGDPRAPGNEAVTLYRNHGYAYRALKTISQTRETLREITADDLRAELDKLKGGARQMATRALRSLFGFLAKNRKIFRDPTARLKGTAHPIRLITPLDEPLITRATTAATTPVLRLVIALAAIHAARPSSMRRLTLDDLDLPNQRITIDGHNRPLGALTHQLLLAWLEERNRTWPHTANQHLLISRVSANELGPVTYSYLKQELLLRHRVRLSDLRATRILEEGLRQGPDALHLHKVFGGSTATSMRYTRLIQQLLADPQPASETDRQHPAPALPPHP